VTRVSIGLTAVIAALLAFSVVQMTHRMLLGAQGIEGSQWTTSQLESLAQAESEVGYEVRTPSVPPGFEVAEVRVEQRPGTGNLPKRVVLRLIASDDEGSWIVLTQDPVLKGIGGAEDVQIEGISGQRAFQEGGGRLRHSLVTYFWRANGVGHELTASLGESLDEDDIRRIAESLI
jgi:hypothetical protein